MACKIGLNFQENDVPQIQNSDNSNFDTEKMDRLQKGGVYLNLKTKHNLFLVNELTNDCQPGQMNHILAQLECLCGLYGLISFYMPLSYLVFFIVIEFYLLIRKTDSIFSGSLLITYSFFYYMSNIFSWRFKYELEKLKFDEWNCIDSFWWVQVQLFPVSFGQINDDLYQMTHCSMALHIILVFFFLSKQSQEALSARQRKFMNLLLLTTMTFTFIQLVKVKFSVKDYLTHFHGLLNAQTIDTTYITWINYAVTGTIGVAPPL